MASSCPKCHATIENDAICCADVQYTWKCKECSKTTRSFVVPYGRCYLCGGELEVIENYTVDDPAAVKAIEEAIQHEVDMYSFYRIAKERTKCELLRNVLEELYLKEEDHIKELDVKYHLHLDDDILKPKSEADLNLTGWLFKGIKLDGDCDEHVTSIYKKAIEMEERTRDHFKARAESLPEGVEKDVFMQLAAEEEEHVALLMTECAQFHENK
ncbi:hypothetical protein KAI87_00585 [Myxococcota bacterium]|nr:hypothetical protein [Myxococcota bacterium]